MVVWRTLDWKPKVFSLSSAVVEPLAVAPLMVTKIAWIPWLNVDPA